MSDLRKFSGLARDMDTALQAPAPQSGVLSRTTFPDRVQLSLNAMYAEERRVNAILQTKQRNILALYDKMRAENDRARREFQEHYKDLEAFQAKTDRLDNEHRARFHFQRKEKDLETQLARERAQDARNQSPSRTQLQRDYTH